MSIIWRSYKTNERVCYGVDTGDNCTVIGVVCGPGPSDICGDKALSVPEGKYIAAIKTNDSDAQFFDEVFDHQHQAYARVEDALLEVKESQKRFTEEQQNRKEATRLLNMFKYHELYDRSDPLTAP